MCGLRRFVAAIALAALAGPLAAFGAQEAVIVQGRVFITGNDPHTFVVLVADEEAYRLTGSAADFLARDFQNHEIRVEGFVVEEREGALRPVLEVTTWSTTAPTEENPRAFAEIVVIEGGELTRGALVLVTGTLHAAGSGDERWLEIRTRGVGSDEPVVVRIAESDRSQLEPYVQRLVRVEGVVTQDREGSIPALVNIHSWELVEP